MISLHYLLPRKYGTCSMVYCSNFEIRSRANKENEKKVSPNRRDMTRSILIPWFRASQFWFSSIDSRYLKFVVRSRLLIVEK